MNRKRKNGAAKREQGSAAKPACGLCGGTSRLVRTECCGQWICDDEDSYKLFSFDRNSCYRNHRRLTLCGYHHVEEHQGAWQTCRECRTGFETEMFVYFGTNEYNFEVLEDPPEYEPTKCSECGTTLVLGEGGYSTRGDKYICERCTGLDVRKLFGGSSKSREGDADA